ncbi:MAG: SMP-30/gluconolactonase/LRE family protein [Roseobacter sp.]
MTLSVFDTRACRLGEGPLWHPERKQLFWFDIVEKQLLSRGPDGPLTWQFDEPVSAAGWIDSDTLLIGSATGLWRFSIESGDQRLICNLEHDNPNTRSNDGRADPWGGFWIGTMGRHAQAGAGAIYRYYQGQLRRLISNVTISNAICFAPDRSCAYFTDTSTGKVMSLALDRTGWPCAPPCVFVDLSPEGINPDGAVTDANGTVWIAQWGGARVAAYDTSGQFIHAINVGVDHTTCPAFGGDDFTTLYVTSATQGIAAAKIASVPEQGMTFQIKGAGVGLPEPRVLL